MAGGRPGRPPGQPKSGGRTKGTPNKYQNDVREMLLAALDGAGGVQYLIDRAHDQPVAFLGLIGKVLPLQVTGKDGAALQVDFRWSAAPEVVATATIDVVAEKVSDETDLIEWAPPDLAND